LRRAQAARLARVRANETRQRHAAVAAVKARQRSTVSHAVASAVARERAHGDARVAAATSRARAASVATRTTASDTDPRFNYCYEANAAGYGPYFRGTDPEYDWYRDNDGDGEVCE
jgi:hypothetical protein